MLAKHTINIIEYFALKVFRIILNMVTVWQNARSLAAVEVVELPLNCVRMALNGEHLGSALFHYT